MKIIHKKLIAIIFVISLCFTCLYQNATESYASKVDQYLVLVQQKNGTWKEYTDLIEAAESGNLMIKAKPFAKALGFAYIKNNDETFAIKKDAGNYNTYTKNRKEFIHTVDDTEKIMMAPGIAYTSEISKYNLCQVSTLNTLVFYKFFSAAASDEYSDYAGIICYSKYEEIPSELPQPKKKSTGEQSPTPSPEPSSLSIEGVEFPVRDKFLSVDKSLSDWGSTAIIWSELEKAVDSKIIASTDLNIESKIIKFSHLAADCDGIYLEQTKKGYKLSISVKLEGSVIAEQNADIVKAMVATISSKPSSVYQAIYESFTTDDAHGINEDKYVTIGDCKIKVEIKDGIVTYLIRESE